MKEITLEELLEAGCHFGHQVTRSNPKARDFVFEARDNIQIIDLAKTKEGLDEAAARVKALGQNGASLLIVGTKRQARDIIEQEVKRVQEVVESQKKDPNTNLFYITERWIGGILTNFPEVSKNFKKLKDLRDRVVSEEEKEKYTKKEIGLFEKEIQRLESFYKGIAGMTKKPDALFIVDSHMEDLAVREALNMGVETIGIVDTNADPYLIDYPIPANDDAVGSLKLIITHILDSFAEGVREQKVKEEPKAEGADGAGKKKAEPKPKAEGAEGKKEGKTKEKKPAKKATPKKPQEEAK